MVKVKCPVCGGTGRVPWNFGGGCWHIVQNPPNIVWQMNGIGAQTTSQSFTTTNYCCHDKVCPACHGTGMQESGCCGCCNKCRKRACMPNPCPVPYIPFIDPCPTTTPYDPFYQTGTGSTTNTPNTTYTISCTTNVTPTSSSSANRKRRDQEL